jgi:hypothetical protein
VTWYNWKRPREYEVVLGRYVLLTTVRVGGVAMPRKLPTAVFMKVVVDRDEVEKQPMEVWRGILEDPSLETYDDVCYGIALAFQVGNLTEYVLRTDWSVTQDYT